MESQKLSNSDNFALGRRKKREYPPGGIDYFVKRVANITGYRKADVKTVLCCLCDVLDECVVEASEDDTKGFNFGPVEIFGRFINRSDLWKNPKTGELVQREPHIVPTARLRPAWKDSFATQQRNKRKELNVGIDGKPL